MPERTNDAKIARRLTITLVLFALYTIGRFGIDQIRPPGLIPNDYVNFHRASERLAKGEAVYVPADESPFKYSPTFLLGFKATFAQLPVAWAWALWCALSIAGFAWATRFLWRECFAGHTGWSVAALVGGFGVCAWHGYLELFSYGQGDMLLYAIFIAAVAVSASRSLRADALAAALMSWLLITKPQSAILCAFFLIARRGRLLALTAGLTALLLVLPAGLWGWTKQLEMFSRWRMVLGHQSVEFLTGNLNQSLAATLARLCGHRDAVLWLTPLFVALGAAVVLATAWWRPLPRDASPARRARLAIGTILLYMMICPLSWRWSTFVWLPIGAYLGAEAARSRKWTTLVPLGAFVLNAIVLQTFVAHALGIAEIDELSQLGLYTLGNLALCIAFMTTNPEICA